MSERLRSLIQGITCYETIEHSNGESLAGSNPASRKPFTKILISLQKVHQDNISCDNQYYYKFFL